MSLRLLSLLRRQKIKSDGLSYRTEQLKRVLKLLMPGTETLILLVGLVCTSWGKMAVIQRQNPPALLTEFARVVFPDVLFFTAVFLVISCLYMLKPSTFAARCGLLIAVLVSVW